MNPTGTAPAVTVIDLTGPHPIVAFEMPPVPAFDSDTRLADVYAAYKMLRRCAEQPLQNVGLERAVVRRAARTLLGRPGTAR